MSGRVTPKGQTRHNTKKTRKQSKNVEKRKMVEAFENEASSSSSSAEENEFNVNSRRHNRKKNSDSDTESDQGLLHTQESKKVDGDSIEGGAVQIDDDDDDDDDEVDDAVSAPDLNQKNSEMLRNETFVEDTGNSWATPLMCCGKLQGVSPAQAFFCVQCMYGRAMTVALEQNYVSSCILCWCCQPCRRKEIRLKYNIRGSTCDDGATCVFCPCAVGPQIIGEVIKHEPFSIDMCGGATAKPSR